MLQISLPLDTSHCPPLAVANASNVSKFETVPHSRTWRVGEQKKGYPKVAGSILDRRLRQSSWVSTSESLVPSADLALPCGTEGDGAGDLHATCLCLCLCCDRYVFFVLYGMSPFNSSGTRQKSQAFKTSTSRKTLSSCGSSYTIPSTALAPRRVMA